MLTLTNFLTVAGAAAITTALVALIKTIWKTAPDRIMVYLIEHRDRVVSQPALLTVGWPDEPRVGQDLYRHIHRIRQLIESDPDRPQWLLIRKDRGYVLVSAPLGHTRRKKEQP